MKTYTRREMIACLMAGGMVTAAGLWTPGSKLISIPKKQFYGPAIANQNFTLTGNVLEYTGPEHQGITIKQLHDWLAEYNPNLLMDHSTHHDDMMVSIEPGYRLKNPEHLTHGSIIQDSGKPEWQQGGANREIWSNAAGFNANELVTDKIYFSDAQKPRERITVAESGNLGLR